MKAKRHHSGTVSGDPTTQWTRKQCHFYFWDIFSFCWPMFTFFTFPIRNSHAYNWYKIDHLNLNCVDALYTWQNSNISYAFYSKVRQSQRTNLPFTLLINSDGFRGGGMPPRLVNRASGLLYDNYSIVTVMEVIKDTLFNMLECFSWFYTCSYMLHIHQ